MEFAENSFGMPVCSELQFPFRRHLFYYVHTVCKYVCMIQSNGVGSMTNSVERGNVFKTAAVAASLLLMLCTWRYFWCTS